MYLGFWVGPGKGTTTWRKPMQKLMDRVTAWRLIPSGLHLATEAYNTFGVSVLSYIGALEDPPAWAYPLESKALLHAVQGMGPSWVEEADLWWLSENWSMPHSFRHLRHYCLAMKLRVALTEPWPAAEGTWQSRAEALEGKMRGMSDDTHDRWVRHQS